MTETVLLGLVVLVGWLVTRVVMDAKNASSLKERLLRTTQERDNALARLLEVTVEGSRLRERIESLELVLSNERKARSDADRNAVLNETSPIRRLALVDSILSRHADEDAARADGREAPAGPMQGPRTAPKEPRPSWVDGDD